jgi:hypothetical protein
MIKNILLPVAIGATVALSGAAFADSATKNPELYKESQAKPHAKPMEGAVKPGAQEAQKLHKNVQGAGKEVRDRAVNPDAPMNKKLYKESQGAATKEMPKTTK